MKAKDLLRVLSAAPLGYTVVRQNGSHKILVSDRHPRLVFSFHDSATVAPGVVKKVLTKKWG
jgi:predicted RNA binding protein YcfA (HicA-like mRNA interferase family)